MAVNLALTQNGRPLGSFPHNRNWRHQAAWYAPFQNLCRIQFEVTGRATEPDGLPADHPNAHISWSMEDDVPGRNKPLDYYRKYFLQDAPPIGAPNGRDVRQYNHLVLDICGGPNNIFEAETMKDLCFFLRHAARRNAIAIVLHIKVCDMTAGPYLSEALTQLLRCTGLRQLTLRMCRGCKDFYASAASKQSWANTTLNVDRDMLHLDIKCRTALEKLCNTCEEREEARRAGVQPMAAANDALRDWRAAQPAQL